MNTKPLNARPPQRVLFTIVTALVLLASSGCSNLSRTERGAVIGAAGGAVLGGAVGRATGSTARGAIIGAVVGGAAGAYIGSRMRDKADVLSDRLPDATVEPVGEGILVTFESGILFAFDSSDLRSQARQNLADFAEALADMRDANVLVAGHTDSVGADEYNYDLSLRRAQSAVDYLAAEGIPLDHLQLAGLGESEPVASNDTEAGQEQNRRVELAIFASEEMQEDARRRTGP